MGSVMAEGHQPQVEAGMEQHSRFRPRTEGIRERDVFRYLQPWMEMYKPTTLERPAFPVDGSTNRAIPKPEPCPDVALAAFAQLCAFRLSARRCLITLISSSTEYVLAEATRSMALQYTTVENPKDEPFLGTCCFPRREGLNSSALGIWRKQRQVREAPQNDTHYFTEGTSGHWLIISDLRNAGHHESVLAQRSAGSRFYFSVPLRAAVQGSVIGSLVILDDKPRYGVSALEMSFMEDLSDTITQHLDSTVVRSQRQRSERLIQGLRMFNSGQGSLRSWWETQEDAKDSSTGRYTAKTLTDSERKDRADREFGLEQGFSDWVSRSESSAQSSAAVSRSVTRTTSDNSGADTDRKYSSVNSQDFSSKSAWANSEQPEPLDESTDSKPSTDPRLRLPGPQRRTKIAHADRSQSLAFDLAAESAQTYARASNLLREALDAHGVVFVDANAAVPVRKQGHVYGDSDSHWTSNAEGGVRTTDQSDLETLDAEPTNRCKILGFATRTKSSISGPDKAEHSFELSETYLSSLIKRYPQGHVFHYGERGDLSTSSGEELSTTASSEDSGGRTRRGTGANDGQRLAKIMVGARSIAFYPVWDGTQQRWRSCSFVWSTSSRRSFDRIEDITYLSAWDCCMLAELARLETLAADTAKATFISSVSHELRSPLHGVLAGVELLQDSKLTAFQLEMVNTIDVSGRTLLDTVNHILDYSKISSFTRARRKEQTNVASLPHAESFQDSVKSNEMVSTSYVDLALLTEETIECVVAAHHFRSLSSTSVDPLPLSSSESRKGRPRSERRYSDHDGISVVLDIAHRENWIVKIQPGGWTRIITNLVGNALKYTSKGAIVIRLEASDQGNEADDDEEAYSKIKLAVEDTGIGMSKQFLSNGAFTPFTQADSNSVGTGLGLSIVKTISREMGAKLDISSEPGAGTRASLMFDGRLFPRSDAQSLGMIEEADTDFKKHRGKKIHLLTSQDVDFYAPREKLVAEALARVSSDWLGLKSLDGPKIDSTNSVSFCALGEQDLISWNQDDPAQIAKTLSGLTADGVRIIVIGRSVGSSTLDPSLLQLADAAIFVQQPIGPRKLLRTLTAALASDTSDSTATPHVDRTMLSPDAPLDRAKRSASPPAKRGVVTTTANSSSRRPRQRPKESGNMSGDDIPTSRASPTTPSKLVNVKTANSQQRDVVLLVEDNAVNMKLLTALMGKLNHKYICAENGREAYDAYKEAPASFRLILMDISMPVLDGYGATAKIRELERRRGHLRCKIVALTGVTSTDAKARAFDCGVDEYFPKPVRMKELRELMDRLDPAGVPD